MNELTKLAKGINAEHEACVGSAADAVTHAIKAGEMLIEAKAGLDHGEFIPWVDRNCRFKRRQAQNYMRVAKAHRDALLPAESINAALRMIAEEKEFFKDWTESEIERMERVESGETVLADLHDDGDIHLVQWAREHGLYVQIDRNTAWGNVFIMDEDGDRDEVCESYRIYLGLKPSLQRRLEELRGKVLGCWCYPERCHGNVLIDQLEGASDEVERVGCHR